MFLIVWKNKFKADDFKLILIVYDSVNYFKLKNNCKMFTFIHYFMI